MAAREVEGSRGRKGMGGGGRGGGLEGFVQQINCMLLHAISKLIGP